MQANHLLPALLALSLTGPLAALAQTGRIAHFSHGGSLATLAAAEKAADNFGNPPPYFLADSVRYLSETRVVQYGKWYWVNRKEKTDTLRLPQKMLAAEAARYVQHSYDVRWVYGRPKVLVGFDSTTKVPAAQPSKSKRKATANWLLPVPPAGPGLALLVLAGLAGAGWLLVGPRPSLAEARA